MVWVAAHLSSCAGLRGGSSSPGPTSVEGSRSPYSASFQEASAFHERYAPWQKSGLESRILYEHGLVANPQWALRASGDGGKALGEGQLDAERGLLSLLPVDLS